MDGAPDQRREDARGELVSSFCAHGRSLNSHCVRCRPDSQTEQVRVFLAEIALVCQKHELSISYEDDEICGSFVVRQFNWYDASALENSMDESAWSVKT